MSEVPQQMGLAYDGRGASAPPGLPPYTKALLR